MLRNLDDAKDQIEELTQEKARVSEENERLKAQLEVTNKEVAELEVTLANVKKTLVSAEALVEKLRDEFIRWNKEVYFFFQSGSFFALKIYLL